MKYENIKKQNQKGNRICFICRLGRQRREWTAGEQQGTMENRVCRLMRRGSRGRSLDNDGEESSQVNEEREPQRRVLQAEKAADNAKKSGKGAAWM